MIRTCVCVLSIANEKTIGSHYFASRNTDAHTHTHMAAGSVYMYKSILTNFSCQFLFVNLHASTCINRLQHCVHMYVDTVKIQITKINHEQLNTQNLMVSKHGSNIRQHVTAIKGCQ